MINVSAKTTANDSTTAPMECPSWCIGAHEWHNDADNHLYRWHTSEVSSVGSAYSLQLMRLDHLTDGVFESDATLVRLDMDDNILLPHQAIQLSADLALAHVRAAGV